MAITGVWNDIAKCIGPVSFVITSCACWMMYKKLVITNQSGIARGYFTKEAYYNLTNYMLNLFKENDIYLTAVLHCPHGDGQCNCRKPRPGLFYYAAAQFNIDFRKSFAVGNELRDLCICSYEPVTGILLSEGNEPVGESGDSIICLNDLYSACRFISERSRQDLCANLFAGSG